MGTFTVTGTGGIIEGNLGAANVNVNLDSSLYFDGNVNDDRIVVSDDDTAATGDFGTGAFSVSAWFYIPEAGFTTSDSWGSILGKGYTTSAPSNTWGFVRGAANNNIYWQNATDAGGGWGSSFGISPSGVDNHLGSWVHVCVTRNGTAMKLYFNGVLNNTNTASETSNLTNAQDFKIGTNNSNAQSTNITTADVKLFDDELTAAEVQYLASKVQADPDVGGLDNCESWWKINEGTGTNVVNHKKGAANGTITGAEWQFDKFSVNVQDTMTTDGTFTVTQGKVEGLSLTTGEFDGDDDFVELGSQAGDLRLYDSYGAIGLWMKTHNGDGGDGHQRILDKSNGGSASGGYALLFNGDGINGRISAYMNGGGTVTDVEPTGGFVDNRFYHILWTWDGTNHYMYIDGVLEKTTASTTLPPATTTNMRIGSWNHSTGREFDGNIGDVKIYDYAFIADQVASLYSGDYNTTPLHWWKLDEGSGTTATDSGTSSTLVNGVMTNGATYTNGTLDLDSTLTIEANGTLSAPRGSLDLHSHFTIAADTSTFTHNNGTVTLTSNVELFPMDFDSSENARHIFYDIAHTAGTFYMERAVEIHGTYTKTGGTLNHYAKCTFGTATTSGNMVINHTTWNMYGLYGNPMLYAANELFPVNIGGSVSDPIQWDTIDQRASARDTVTHIKGIDFGNTAGTPATKNTTTGGGGARIKLDGDCEFDGFTLSANDTLDLNGKRAEFSGLLSSSGTIECNADDGTNALVVADSVNTSSATTGNMNLIETGDGHTHTLTSSTITNWMLNGGTISNSAHGHAADNIIVGAGKFDVGHNVASGTPLVNVTTATGAELDGNTFEIPLSGDFTTSGGLIGKSGLDFDGSTATSSPFTFLDVPYDLSNLQNSDATFEMWINPESKSGDTKQSGVINGYVGGQTNRWQLDHFTNDTFNFNSHENNSSINFSVNLGKMNHIALVFDDSENLLQIYHDGKLVGQNTLGTGIDLGTVGADPDLGISWQTAAKDTIRSNYMGFKGQFYMYRIFNTARTPAQLRADMFNTHGNMTSTTGLQVMYQFDEGTGGAGDKVDNKQGTTSRDGVLANAGAAPNWVGGGTFVQGTSTLKFSKSGTQTLNFFNSDNFNNITINAGSTLSLNGFGVASGATIDLFGNLVVTGTLTDSSTSEMKLRTSGKTHDFSGTMTGLYKLGVSVSSGDLNLPALNTKRLDLTSSSSVIATGNHTLTEELELNDGTTYNANGKTITAKQFDINGTGAFTLGAGSLVLNDNSQGFKSESGSVLNAGPGCTIGGDDSGQKVPFQSQNGFQIVGDIDDLNVTGEELTVIGTVTNCTGDILQFTPGHDTSLSLETDTAEDRDIRLGGPSLDNANHLIPE